MESLPNTPDHIPARELLTVMPVAVEGFNKLLSRNRTPENRILGAIDHMERENSNVYEGMKEGLDKLKVVHIGLLYGIHAPAFAGEIYR